MTDLTAWLLILFALAGWAVTILLARGATHDRFPVLEERAGTSALLTVIRTGIAALGIAHLLDAAEPDAGILTLGAIAVGVILGADAILWLVAYVLGRFS